LFASATTVKVDIIIQNTLYGLSFNEKYAFCIFCAKKTTEREKVRVTTVAYLGRDISSLSVDLK